MYVVPVASHTSFAKVGVVAADVVGIATAVSILGVAAVLWCFWCNSTAFEVVSCGYEYVSCSYSIVSLAFINLIDYHESFLPV